ncbi:MAG: PQQ-binding-like beta-propeller repeat protein [Ignavibacteriaceae bacterium]|jgi:hypothetical protein
MKIFRTISLITFLVLISQELAEAQMFEWAKGMSSSTNASGRAIFTDVNGNSYVTGFFEGTTTFDTMTLTSYGGFDIFIAKYDNAGNCLWIKQAGGTLRDNGLGISTDATGNCYVTGFFNGTTTFDTTTITSYGSNDIFIAKYDSTGNCLWVKQAGGASGDIGYGISTDATGNSFITGAFGGTATFGTKILTSYGNPDIFIAKYDNAGSCMWVKQAGGTFAEDGYGISTDAFGNSYITGDFQETATFGTTTITSFGAYDIFIAKYDDIGKCLWAKQAGGTLNENSRGISIDATGNSYITGWSYSVTATFDTTTLASFGDQDIFIAKYDNAGNCLWAKQAGGTSLESGWGISSDVNGNSYITGNFYGTATFGTRTLTSTTNNMFVAKYDNVGNALWAKQASADYGIGISASTNGNVYITGVYRGDANFEDFNLNGTGGFITKIGPTIVTLLEPKNGEVNQPLDITFKWSNANNEELSSTSYLYELVKDTVSLSEMVADFTVDTFKTVTNLEHLAKYYWRIKSQGGWSEFSNWNSFTTVIVMPKPLLTTPLDSAVNIFLTPTLIWEATPTAIKYRLQVSTDSLFQTYAFNDSTITNPSKQITGLKNNEHYFWRVQAFNVEGWGEFSAVRLFYTIVSPPVQQPIISGNQTAVLSWTQAYGNNLINYHIYRAVGQQTFAFLDSVTNTQLTYKDSGLVNDINYKYKIKALSKFNTESDFSNEVSSLPFNKKPKATVLTDVVIKNLGKILEKELTFSSSGSIDEDGNIDSVFWFINEKLIQASKGLTNITNNFRQGTSNVELVVQDNQGAKDSSKARIDIAAASKKLFGSVDGGVTALSDDMLYISDNSKSQTLGAKLYMVDGDLMPIFDLIVNEQIRTAASVSFDSSVFITNGANLNGFNKFGISMWPTVSLGGLTQVTPTIDSLLKRIYVGVSNKNFIAYDYKTGLPAWFYRPDAPISASAVLTADRKLIFPTEKGTMYGFDLVANPTPTSFTWSKEFGDSVVLAPAIDAENKIVVGTKSGRLLKLFFGTAGLVTTIWSTDIGSRITTSPVIDGSGFIYVGCEDGILRKMDPISGEIIWSYNSDGAIRTTPAISEFGRLYFGNDNGVVSCIDTLGNKIWQYENGSAVSANMLHINGATYIGTSDGYVYSFYDGGGSISTTTLGKNLVSLSKAPVWGTYQGNNRRTGSARDNGITTSIKDEVVIPTTYALMQNFPNPFNPTTTIRYSLPFDSKVTIKIYNVLGQDVKLLRDETVSAGNYEVQFNSDKLSSGIYFYRISAESIDGKEKYSSIKKMILLK